MDALTEVETRSLAEMLAEVIVGGAEEGVCERRNIALALPLSGRMV
jgi:hypothetical protein